MSGVLRSAGIRALRQATQQPTLMRQTGQGARGFAADPHGPPKVNAWEAPTDPGSWKGEHVVFAVLAGWVVVIKGSMTALGK
mmetsp:Transcript_27892/g.61007  ORF Transcript_27892/g.61007 Transcript_27892/m.61007 type:complete len:82 (+) Transcript_27892:94-339(+)|eukprot:CAMPEP_0118925864 /NCGR_PEP_ID=MMETSP1169-20130426/3670_1 /TAXON_ID=36882 /ORGANISM="Pyramimonas obovata, Strain CCMP722" /LENGTH=81 /DNA_ID=CAMNT_0006867283 /DNA_START=110 /DNA_END=355 /DNA_ORIENTATION=-